MFYETRSTPREAKCPCEGNIHSEREEKARAVLTEAQSAQEVYTVTGSSCYIIVTELYSEEIYMAAVLKIC